jgi:hypothetical protein
MTDESAIRKRAYALWEKDGYPEGAAKFYWHLARVQLESRVQESEKETYSRSGRSNAVSTNTYALASPSPSPSPHNIHDYAT